MPLYIADGIATCIGPQMGTVICESYFMTYHITGHICSPWCPWRARGTRILALGCHCFHMSGAPALELTNSLPYLMASGPLLSQGSCWNITADLDYFWLEGNALEAWSLWMGYYITSIWRPFYLYKSYAISPLPLNPTFLSLFCRRWRVRFW